MCPVMSALPEHVARAVGLIQAFTVYAVRLCVRVLSLHFFLRLEDKQKVAVEENSL